MKLPSYRVVSTFEDGKTVIRHELLRDYGWPAVNAVLAYAGEAEALLAEINIATQRAAYFDPVETARTIMAARAAAKHARHPLAFRAVSGRSQTNPVNAVDADAAVAYLGCTVEELQVLQNGGWTWVL